MDPMQAQDPWAANQQGNQNTSHLLNPPAPAGVPMGTCEAQVTAQVNMSDQARAAQADLLNMDVPAATLNSRGRRSNRKNSFRQETLDWHRLSLRFQTRFRLNILTRCWRPHSSSSLPLQLMEEPCTPRIPDKA